MGDQPDDLVGARRVQHLRLVLGGRVAIEREIVRLCSRRHFDKARVDDLMRQLDGPPKSRLQLVNKDD